MANTQSVDVRQSSKSLVSVQFHEDDRDLLLQFVVVFQDSEHRLGHVIHDDVQIDFVWLVSLGVEGMLESDHVGVIKLLHDLQLSVLIPFILVHLLDGHRFVVLIDSSLEHNTERSISYDTVSIVSERGRLLFFLLWI